jgi:hypothetical protein|tara:strand:- start:224 stop:406 length:183 start_codon:yes stop_codon:yes gene_type:complete
MQVGDLVRIRHNEHHGLFVITQIGKKRTLADERWAEMLSLSTTKRVFEMVRSLEVINESR